MAKVMSPVILILAVAVIAIGAYFVFANTKPNYKIIETHDFSCPGMTGFTFKYPVFKGWEIKQTVKIRDGECSVFLNYPDNMDFEKAPQIMVSYLRHPDSWSTTSAHGQTGDVETEGGPKSNRHHIVYHKAKSLHGFVFEKLFLDYEMLKHDEIVVRLHAGGDEYGFSQELFWQTVIESFRVTDKTIAKP